MDKNSNNHKLLVMELKKISESKGITRREIANRTGLLESNVSRFFSLRHKPRLDIFLEIAKAIGVNFVIETNIY